MRQKILAFGKDGLIYGIGTAASRFSSIILLPVFTKHLSPEDFGTLAMLALLVMVAQPIFSMGLGAVMGVTYFDGHGTKASTVWTVFSLHMLSALLLLAIAWACPGSLGTLVMLPPESSTLVSITLSGLAFTMLGSAFAQSLQFERKAFQFVIASFIGVAGAALISLVAVVYFDLGVMGVVAGQAAGNLLASTAFLWCIPPSIRKFSFDTAKAKELLRLGAPLIPSFVFVFIIMYSNRYMLEWLHGLDAVGIYSVGFSVGAAISIVTSGIATAWYPFFVRYIDKQHEAEMLFGRIFTYYVFGVGTICLMFFLFANPVIALLTTETFQHSASILGFVAMAYFFQTAFNFFLPAVYFSREVKFVSVSQGVASIIAIIVNYALIKSYAELGAGIGLALGNLLMAMLMYYWNCIRRDRYIRVRYEWSRIASFSIVFIAVMALYWSFSPKGLLAELLFGLFLASSTLVVVYALLTTSERAMIRQWGLNKDVAYR